MTGAASPLHVGILGAARIAPVALIRPARTVNGVHVTAVAARDPARAEAFASRHGILRVFHSYQALIEDPSIHAIYNALPNSLHGRWSVRALEAGKHVLCEKPLAANAAEAERMAESARANGKVLMEAFHYRYHPLMSRLLEILHAGQIGAIRHVEAHMCSPNFRRWDIRYRYDLAGGATMDLGCYTIHLLRALTGVEPRVTAAQAIPAGHDRRVDRAMTADFTFGDSCTGRIICSMWSRRVLDFSLLVLGDRGSLRVWNPYLPHFFSYVQLSAGKRSVRECTWGDSTYWHQLQAFVAAIQNRAVCPTTPEDSLANMQVIDNVYRAAGLPVRQPAHG